MSQTYTNPTNTDTQNMKENLKNEGEHAKRKGGELLEDASEQVKEYASDINKMAKKYIEKNPLGSLGIAAVAGAALAFLLCR